MTQQDRTPRRGKKPKPVHDDPKAQYLSTKQRVDAQRGSGRFAEHDRIRDELIADHKGRLEEQIAADGRPLTERVPEYVLDFDADGTYIGLKLAR